MCVFVHVWIEMYEYFEFQLEGPFYIFSNIEMRFER